MVFLAISYIHKTFLVYTIFCIALDSMSSVACICEICFFRDFMGLKRQKFSWSPLARDLYTRQLACEPQTGSLAYFSVAVRNGTKKRPVLLIYIQQHAGCCLFCTSMPGEVLLKVHGNLNKGTSGSMKLN